MGISIRFSNNYSVTSTSMVVDSSFLGFKTKEYTHISVKVGIKSNPGISSSIKTIAEAIFPSVPLYISLIFLAAYGAQIISKNGPTTGIAIVAIPMASYNIPFLRSLYLLFFIVLLCAFINT